MIHGLILLSEKAGFNKFLNRSKEKNLSCLANKEKLRKLKRVSSRSKESDNICLTSSFTMFSELLNLIWLSACKPIQLNLKKFSQTLRMDLNLKSVYVLIKKENLTLTQV